MHWHPLYSYKGGRNASISSYHKYLVILFILSGGELLDLLEPASLLIGVRDIRGLGHKGLVKDLTKFLLNCEVLDCENNHRKLETIILKSLKLVEDLEKELDAPFNANLQEPNSLDIIKVLKSKFSESSELAKADLKMTQAEVEASPVGSSTNIFFHKLTPLMKDSFYICPVCEKTLTNYKSIRRHLKEIHKDVNMEVSEVKATCLMTNKKGIICNAKVAIDGLNNHFKLKHGVKEDQIEGKKCRGFITKDGGLT